MAVDRRKFCVFGAAVALRVLLVALFPGLPDLLTGRVEVSTPDSSFKRCERFQQHESCSLLSDYVRVIKCRKDYFYITDKSRLTMAVFFTRFVRSFHGMPMPMPCSEAQV